MHLTTHDLSRLANPELASAPQDGDSLALLAAKLLAAPPAGWVPYAHGQSSPLVGGALGPVNGDGTLDTWGLSIVFVGPGNLKRNGVSLDVPAGYTANCQGFAQVQWIVAVEGDVVAHWHGRPPVLN